MEILNLTPNDLGGYDLQSWPEDQDVPPGSGIIVYDLDTKVYYDYNGFVVPSVREEITAEGDSVVYVDGLTANTEAWEAWKSTLPEPVEPAVEKSIWDELDEAYQSGYVEGVDSV